MSKTKSCVMSTARRHSRSKALGSRQRGASRVALVGSWQCKQELVGFWQCKQELVGSWQCKQELVGTWQVQAQEFVST